MTVGLWKRNVIGAAVSAAALAVGATLILQPAWDGYRQTVRPTHIAAPDQPITVDGQTWTVRNVSRSTRQPGSNASLPEGTVLVNVLVERAGPSLAGSGCWAYLVAGERMWRGTGPCGEATSMPMRFLVPADTEPSAVDIRNVKGSILVRLQL
ncbi:hypothetical protein V4U86_10980 [Mycobacterium sp. AMU20-3851]|uniref:hypothetical protein n=1 Tax=Mycobacterium sp. AMU20-3851 TaxID=3122055 RepID=UPI003754A00E